MSLSKCRQRLVSILDVDGDNAIVPGGPVGDGDNDGSVDLATANHIIYKGLV